MQVAKLAGVPDTVITEAKQKLHLLEAASAEQAQGAAPLQVDLFSTPTPRRQSLSQPRRTHWNRRWLNLTPDELTPRQALEQIYALKKQLPK